MLHVEQSEFAALQKSNEALGKQLTKRSAQYVFELRKLLSQEMDMESQEQVMAELLPELIAAQKKGETARQLFGPVSERAKKIIEGPEKEEKEMPYWLMWLDNSLLVFVFLAGMTALLTLFNARGAQYGLVSLLVASIFGGVVFNTMYQLVYRYERPGADRSKKPKAWKAWLIIIALTFVWMMIFSASVLIPAKINPVFDPVLLIIIAALVYGIRYLLKKKLGYKGSFFQR